MILLLVSLSSSTIINLYRRSPNLNEAFSFISLDTYTLLGERKKEIERHTGRKSILRREARSKRSFVNYRMKNNYRRALHDGKMHGEEISPSTTNPSRASSRSDARRDVCKTTNVHTYIALI